MLINWVRLGGVDILTSVLSPLVHGYDYTPYEPVAKEVEIAMGSILSK